MDRVGLMGQKKSWKKNHEKSEKYKKVKKKSWKDHKKEGAHLQCVKNH